MHDESIAIEDPGAEDIASGRRLVHWVVGSTAGVIVLSLLLLIRMEHRQRSVALVSQPKSVTGVALLAAEYRPVHRYVGTLEPWESAKVGPQFISGYITQVMVRPGDRIHRGQVLATLQPERAQAQSDATRMQAKAIEARQAALANEAGRIKGLLKKGIVSENEAEKKLAEAVSEGAKLGAAKSDLLNAELQVQDSTMRAPFDGEVASRSMDPGAFAKPGTEIVTVVDSRTVRITADAPEEDFDLLSAGTPVKIRLLSKSQLLKGIVSRRSSSADESTRTIHFEIDLPNLDRQIPVGTTAELLIEAKEAQKAVSIPLAAAVVRGGKATVFAVEEGKAHKKALAVLGEQEGVLFLAPDLPAGTSIIREGNSQIQEGDAVSLKLH